jgi:hypothetical protein
MPHSSRPEAWPDLPYAAWKETCATLHLWTQIVGFWPGGGGIDHAAFYSYAYPVPEGFSASPVRPGTAVFSEMLGEFILPYDAVRAAPDPDVALLAFLQSTYEAAAKAGDWNRTALECAPGFPGVPRPVR